VESLGSWVLAISLEFLYIQCRSDILPRLHNVEDLHVENLLWMENSNTICTGINLSTARKGGCTLEIGFGTSICATTSI